MSVGREEYSLPKLSKDYTSQICPECGALTGKKELDLREHNCPECGYKTHRDVAAAQVIRNRGVSAVLALCGEEQLT